MATSWTRIPSGSEDQEAPRRAASPKHNPLGASITLLEIYFFLLRYFVYWRGLLPWGRGGAVSKIPSDPKMLGASGTMFLMNWEGMPFKHR